jgi:hypothetical protein
VFKLERERPAFSVYQDTLFYVRDKFVRAYDFNTGSDIGLLNVRKLGSPYMPPKTLSFNPAEKSVIVTITSDNGLYELSPLPAGSHVEVKDSSTDGKKGSGQSAIFVARNRFAVFNKTEQVRHSTCLYLPLMTGSPASLRSSQFMTYLTALSKRSSPPLKQTTSSTAAPQALSWTPRRQSSSMISSNKRP